MRSLDQGILKVFRNLIEDKVKLHSLTLFGSRARGDASSDSDMDVLVIVDELDGGTEKIISECAWQAGFERGVVVVPIVYSRDEWENSPERYSLLALAVKKEGVPA